MKKIALSIIAASLLVGCSTQKNTFRNRSYHKMTSWFNGLFNAEEELAKKHNELKSSFVEDYGEILPLGDYYYAFEEQGLTMDGSVLAIGNSGNTDNSVPKPTGYEAVEAKAIKVIEKHSMMVKGEERNTMIAKAYLLIGKSRYYRGKYYEALDALNYVTKNFPTSKSYVEAEFYTTLADIKGGNYFDGQEKLLKLYENKELSKELRYLVAANYADFLIQNKHYEEAIEPLETAEAFSRNSDERARVLFVLGQVYSKLGQQNEAGEAFARVYKLRPGFDMEVKSQLAIAQNFDPKINDYNNYKTHILNQSKKGIYSSKKNEFYYAIAEMAFKDGNYEEAIEYSKLSLKEPLSDPYIRGKAYENYANIEFKKGNYLYATAYYDSAVTTYTKDLDKNRISTKNDVLKQLMEMHYLVEKNDSILRVAALSKDEQKELFTKHIEKLKKEEEAKVAQEQKEMAEFQLAGKISSFTSSFDNASNSNKFYFYNSNLKNSGMTEFQRIWNNPSLKDNWRKSSVASSNDLEQRETELKGTIVSGDPRRFELDYYMDRIPRTAKELNDLKITKDTTQLALGTGYFDYFDDVNLASTTLEKLVASPPKSKDVELKAIYQLYRVHKDRDKVLEDKYKNIILSQYPNTVYAGYILNPEVDFITPETKEALSDYQIAYTLYQDEKYEEVKVKVSQAIQKYPTEIILAKFALLNAFAVSKTESKENFEKALEIVVLAYDGTEEAKRAKQLLNKLRNPGQPIQLEDDKKQMNQPLKDNRNVSPQTVQPPKNTQQTNQKKTQTNTTNEWD